MSKYYIDTEFLEGVQREPFPFSLLRKNTKPTIDLISIGIVAEDGREYYAISRDFNLKEAWNRYQSKVNMKYKPSFGNGSDGPYNPMYIKEYWLRDNVLKPIHDELKVKEYGGGITRNFTYQNFKWLVNEYGKSNQQIANEVKCFVANVPTEQANGTAEAAIESNNLKPEFYAYYADYDWTVFCWLYGLMIDLPTGFPKYCIDLKQELDKKADTYLLNTMTEPIPSSDWHHNYPVKYLKQHSDYPTQSNEYNALADANWNKKLHEFLNKIK